MSDYNGWENRETWLVPLWLEECPIEELEAPERDDQSDEEYKSEKVSALADALKEYCDEIFYPDDKATGLVADLLIGAVNRINWSEIAEHWVDDVQWEGEE